MNKIFRKILYYKNLYLNKGYINHKGVYLTIDKNIFSENMIYAILSGGYEIGPYRLIKSTLSINDRLVDIGSGIGFISILSAKIIGNNKVYSYEANPDLISIINKNYEINNLKPQIFNLLISSAKTNSEFFIHKDFIKSSVQINNYLKKIIIKTITLNEIILLHNPTYLFLNIEGNEYNVIINENLTSINKLAILYDFDKTNHDMFIKIEDKLKNQNFKRKKIIKNRIYYYEKINAR